MVAVTSALLAKRRKAIAKRLAKLGLTSNQLTSLLELASEPNQLRQVVRYRAPTQSIRVFAMTSKALQAFDHAIQDATELLDHFNTLNKHPPPPEIEVLKRASLVMALAALETYFEDLLVESVTLLSSQSNSSERLSEFIRASLENDLKTFHTPSADRVRPIFVKYLGFDVTEGWSWNNCNPAMARTELNRLAKKRGDIAHRSGRPLSGKPAQHAVTRDAMRKHIHFIKQLVRATDAFVKENANKSNNFAPAAPAAPAAPDALKRAGLLGV